MEMHTLKGKTGREKKKKREESGNTKILRDKILLDKLLNATVG